MYQYHQNTRPRGKHTFKFKKQDQHLSATRYADLCTCRQWDLLGKIEPRVEAPSVGVQLGSTKCPKLRSKDRMPPYLTVLSKTIDSCPTSRMRVLEVIIRTVSRNGLHIYSHMSTCLPIGSWSTGTAVEKVVSTACGRGHSQISALKSWCRGHFIASRCSFKAFYLISTVRETYSMAR